MGKSGGSFLGLCKSCLFPFAKQNQGTFSLQIAKVVFIVIMFDYTHTHTHTRGDEIFELDDG